MTRPSTSELVARFLRLPGIRDLASALSGPGLTVLTYHRVCSFDDYDEDLVSATPEQFKRQLRSLREAFSILGGDALLELLAGRRRLEGRAVCLTFDDGYADNVEAARVMAELGIPAIFFVCTGLVGTSRVPDWDRLAFALKKTPHPSLRIGAVGPLGPWDLEVGDPRHSLRELKGRWRQIPAELSDAFVQAVERAADVAAEETPARPLFMSWSDVRAISDLGHTIGAHSHTHGLLSSLPGERQRFEMTESKRILEAELGKAVRLFAYPVGKPTTFTASTMETARECGFAAAFSFYGGDNRPRFAEPHDLRRISVFPGMSEALFEARAAHPALFSPVPVGLAGRRPAPAAARG